MLALVAGEGALPGVLVGRLDADKVAFWYCEMHGHSSDARGDRPMIQFRVETLGSFIAELKSCGVTDVCFAGRVARPKLDPSVIDAATMPLVPRMMAALRAGDDGALRLVLGFFEEAGIAIRAVQDIAPELLPAAGVLGARPLSEQDKKDAARGVEIIGAMAKVDVGQACIVAAAQAVAVEAIGGTDLMMRSLLGETGLPTGGILVKACKPGQDRRVDMPTVGPQTFQRAAQVGLRGVVIEAEGVMVLDLDTCIEIADAHGLLFWVME